MPKVKDIYQICDELSPFSLQEKWDNSGLNLGNFEQEFQEIYLCLEVDKNIAQSIQANSLIITHHPLIFSPTKNLDPQTYPSNILYTLIAKNCALIAMHTNFDLTHLNPFFAQELLEFFPLEPYLYALKCNQKITFNLLCKKIEEKMQISDYKFVQAHQEIRQLYFCCGSGASLIAHLPPHSCLITGDIKHHDAMLAQSLGISLIDVGHYESEKYFAQILHKNLKNFGYEAIISPLKNPLEFSKPKERQ
ncbi:Nif3-like dinuclear metal center hexameric protein [Helicobacter cholecystus]|uniref:GTP cyclohydrolase 1 type 2 homolog n=1 Tax=Helicobacter cholecystus TaxID=45498 RepID=A0A3D8IXH4_9HELI|nr:Nif3-like dinuclear metal center hexameric protein [Helicobacter cholecystus]RDU69967.1 Nif3-like dinuclear metal center hexameric protein [Helicobacter cholecystus]VEJ24866.1 NIF3 family protein [Helicobacter cholecystus]